ncbi:Eukaryotic translation initiation factor 3 subunit D [Entamoeba marina]
MSTQFDILNFPSIESTSLINSDSLPYSKTLTKEFQELHQDFNQIYDFSNKTFKQFKTKQKDGFVMAEEKKSTKKPKIGTAHTVPSFSKIILPTDVPKSSFVSITNDKVISKLAEDNNPTIFMSQEVAAAIMVCWNSVLGFDFCADVKENGQVFFYERDQGMLSLITVNENSTYANFEEEGPLSMKSLFDEATQIEKEKDLLISQKGETYECKVGDEQFDAPVENNGVFGYHKFNVSGIDVIIRTNVNGINEKGDSYVYSYSHFDQINSYDKLITDFANRKGKLITEAKMMNMWQFSRHAIEAYLSDAEMFKLFYVAKKDDKHVIVDNETYLTTKFLTQMSLDMNSSWGSLKTVCSRLQEEGKGKYAIVRDQNYKELHIYKTD